MDDARTRPGEYWQVSHLCMVLGLRGRLPFAVAPARSWSELPPLGWGGGPDPVRALVRRVSPGPHLDLIGRDESPGWEFGGGELAR